MIRLLIAGAISMAVSLVGCWSLIRVLVHYKVGQPIRDDVPEGHRLKSGTPTMGGAAVAVAALTGYVVSDVFGGIYTRTGIIVMLTIAAGGFVGFLDDIIKVRAARNLGLTMKMKIIGLLVVGIGFAWALTALTSVHTTLSFTRFDSPGIELGQIGWSIFAVFMILATANAVNVTDGLDGLAAGASGIVYLAYMIIGFWQFDHYDAYQVAHALDLAIVSAAMVGAIVGFLWWNAAPARIFMGDTGSLALGTGLAALALATSTQLLLMIVGALFLIETMSVILQVAVFKVFNRRRLFKMAPLHHDFELRGWPETTVIIRLWILSGICTAVGLCLFYADAVNTGIVNSISRLTP